MGRLGERNFLLMSMVCFALGTGLFFLRPPFVFYMCVGVLLGFATGMLDAGLNAYIASLPDNARLLNFLHAFYGIGALLGPVVASSLLAIQLGWQAIYAVWFLFACILLIGLWLTSCAVWAT